MAHEGFAKLQDVIGVHFQDKDLLTQSMVHRSYLNEHPDFTLEHNERLEFLGDAVLELIVTQYLYTHFNNPEGELTNWRAALVNGKMLASIGRTIGLDQLLFLSKGEAKDGSQKARDYLVANAMEALIGAMYLDQGYDTAKRFVENFVLVELTGILESKSYIDPKSRFQEMAQEKTGITPSYLVLSQEGPDHKKLFRIAVCLGEEQVAIGEGTSKQEAQMAAAEAGLKAKNW